jgi:putative hydrolase of the HAD superfamily
VPLVFLALDDTLLDRSGAFRLWAKGFLDEIAAPQDDLEWLVAVDADGLTSRWDLADLIRDRYRLRVSSIDLVDELNGGPLTFERLDPMVGCALEIAGDAGLVPVVVTNGQADQQESRIRRTGLDRYVADWVISEECGVSKPNPRIFALAAQRVRMRLAGAWARGQPGGGHRRRRGARSAQRVAAPRARLGRQPVRADPRGGQRDPGNLGDHGSALKVAGK